MYGDFIDDYKYYNEKKFKINIPFILPSFFISTIFVRLFNWFYYNRQIKRKKLN